LVYVTAVFLLPTLAAYVKRGFACASKLSACDDSIKITVFVKAYSLNSYEVSIKQNPIYRRQIIMKPFLYVIRIVLASIGGFIAWFLGGIDGYLYVLVIFIATDYVTGVMRSIIERKLSSRIGARGIFKKASIFMLVGLSNLVDEYLLMGTGVFRTIVVFFYISNEGISVLENAYAIGIPIPAKLNKFMQQLKISADEGINDKDKNTTMPDSPIIKSNHHDSESDDDSKSNS